MRNFNSYRRIVLFGLPLAALVVYLWLSSQPAVVPFASPADLVPEEGISQSPHESYRVSDSVPDPRLLRKPDGSVHYKPAVALGRQMHRDQMSQQGDLELVDQVLSHYRFAYKENPVGVENFEITEQLLGKNPMRIVFIDAKCSALRGNQLVDHWGTPYFFHAQSGQDMGLRSAGPDRILWTVDDIEWPVG